MSVKDDILAFLRDAPNFSRLATDPETWRRALCDVAQPAIVEASDHPLRPAQVAAWEGLATNRVGLVLGPPGTGKTHLLAWLIVGYVLACRAEGRPCRVLVTAFTRSAIGNLMDGVANRVGGFGLDDIPTLFAGTPPPGGLSSGIEERGDTGPAGLATVIADLEQPHLVLGASVWSLFKLLETGKLPHAEPLRAPVFDLICIDEASQMPLGHGLMALGGLATNGRIIVAGDDKQLPPIRASRAVKLGERDLGGSLYSFLKSVDVREFPLTETFRLNAPLAAFPEQKFYPGEYVSAVPGKRLEFAEGWTTGLADWERIALDPDWPICVLVHNGPAAATSNSFEAKLVARLTEHLRRLMSGINGATSYDAHSFWRERLAIVSPHRAHNSEIRAALGAEAAQDAFVETVDRIQGKERDAIILSYCVGDPEFALAEAAFIFSQQRLNVAATRARMKLIVLISRKLLEAAPPDQDLLDQAELLREFVFACGSKGSVQILEGESAVTVDVRVKGFTDDPVIADLSPAASPVTPATLTPQLEGVLQAIREARDNSAHEAVAISTVNKLLARPTTHLSDFVTLHALGWISLQQRSSRNGPFWVVKPLAKRRVVFPATAEAVAERMEEVVLAVRRPRRAAYYDAVRDRFAWMDETGGDRLWPHVEAATQAGHLVVATTKTGYTVDLPKVRRTADAAKAPPPPALSDADFVVLNTLETLEAQRINFGVFEGWTSVATLADSLRRPPEEVLPALSRLDANGYLMIAQEQRIRSRMAELAREVRYVKQRFRPGDADERPYLVRSLKVELRDRTKPERNKPLDAPVLALKNALADTPAQVQALDGLYTMLTRQWGPRPYIAGFQERAFEAILRAWHGDGQDTFVISADTGAGKTEAAILPLIAGAAADALSGVSGTRAVIAYPRIRLAANQSQRIAGYLAALAAVPGMPTLTIGLQVGEVPWHFDRLGERDRKAGWEAAGVGSLRFPFFACPIDSCGQPLLLDPGRGVSGCDRLRCLACGWTFDGWQGSKFGIAANPPAFFLPTTDSLHQWLHNPRYGTVFGDTAGFAAPRAVLADEIHLYSHIHGAQVGHTLRRLLGRAAANSPSAHRPIAIGMSATLGNPAQTWGRLIDRAPVETIRPEVGESNANPRGREYFYFVQPEVESRGRDVAGAATTIQSLMCLAHGMRRRTGTSGGYRSLVFLDSIDKLRRLHSAYVDAEEGLVLSAYRTRLYNDSVVTGKPQRECCGEPHGCDSFKQGECWWFAATDAHQETAGGRLQPGSPLHVAAQPISSAARGQIEDMIKGSDIIFSTSSLEVGYDDPNITLVYQHYAPQNLASFIQRKGRGGRGIDDRPITAVTLSIYSPRDSWWFRKPASMINPAGFDLPINPENFFVRRGQVLATLLDGLARHEAATGQTVWSGPGIPTEAAWAAAQDYVCAVYEPEVWVDFGVSSLEELWSKACAGGTQIADGDSLATVREALPWIPNLLFETINLPALHVALPEHTETDELRREDIVLGLTSAAPGNVSRRFHPTMAHWRPPVNGRAPWLAEADYAAALMRPYKKGAASLLAELPLEARASIGADLDPTICRPRTLTLETAGQFFGADWQSGWALDEGKDGPMVAPVQANRNRKRHIKHETRGDLRGFPVVQAGQEQGRALTPAHGPAWLSRIDAFTGDGLGKSNTGLALLQLYWGADCEVRVDDPQAEPVPFAQIFTAPNSNVPLLHGFWVSTEGVRFHVNTERLDRFVTATLARLTSEPAEDKWHRGQMMRYLVESRAKAAGLNVYDAQRGAELFVAAAGTPALKSRLVQLLKFWDAADLAALFENVRTDVLSQHPLLSERRVARVAEALGQYTFKELFQDVLKETKDEAAFSAYIRSVVLHGLSVRLKQSFLQIGHGNERQVLAHVKLPIQFGSEAEDVITVAEVGALGDGTTRTFIERIDKAVRQWTEGFLRGCPNADEDAMLVRFFERRHEHERWRRFDPNNLDRMRDLGRELGVADGALPATLLRVLFDTEDVGIETIDVYDLASEIRTVDGELVALSGRESSAWELTSAAVGFARRAPHSALGRLLAAYCGVEDAAQDDSLSPESRLADQVYRLSARLCVDGCQACLHQGGHLMSDSLVAASVSRRLLDQFLER
ncbi:AAA domain-containing protein [Azospirillum brasilense]|uniref:AAA domain-containing protein n=1 Tax=Azospirillum brasilense TaxID=192 RepID=UPI001EDBF1D3|nr:AAA domain-containing protein [Azospirillum brasilense]UKJ75443.1 AAA family ATPase [Azospirillum brasilense]